MSDLLHFKVATVSDIKGFFNKILIAIDRKLALVLQNATESIQVQPYSCNENNFSFNFFKSLNTRLEFSFRVLACSRVFKLSRGKGFQGCACLPTVL